MVRKVIVTACLLAILVTAGLGSQAHAYSIYEGTIPSTIISYFRDIVSGIGFNENYICFRGGQNEYYMIVGDLSYDGYKVVLNGDGRVYSIRSDGNYNSTYSYNVDSVIDTEIIVYDNIIYSDVGAFPQLISRGEKYEILSTILMCVALCGFVVWSIIRPR